MSKFGLKIKSIEAAPLYNYNLGLRTRYDTIDAMFCNSLFSNFIRKHGLKDYNNNFTRDIICLSFSFGTRSYEEEYSHLNKLLQKQPENAEKITEHINFCINNADKYVKLSKKDLRKTIYENGITVPWINRDGTIDEIHYKMLYRNPSKAKVGKCMFIRDELYDIAHEWLTMGIRHTNKIVEISAYAPLSTSTIEGTITIPIKDIVILKDQDSLFNTMTKVVGEKNGVCYVEDKNYDVTNVMWDGMALIDKSICSSNINGMALLRNHFFKACAFKTNIQLFFKDYCQKNHIDYQTYTIKDMFGRKHKLKDIKLITTDSACKWLKFVDVMGGSDYKAFQYWSKRVRDDGNVWGVVKTDHASKLGNVQQMSYQMVNTLPVNKDEVGIIADTSINYVEQLKFDDYVYYKFLRKNANIMNNFDMLADIYKLHPTIVSSDWWRCEKRDIIKQYVRKLRTGKITVNGDNLTVCGNPYALLLYTIGEDWEKDPTLNYEKGTIQCYTPRFDDGEYLCAIRSPENSQNNIAYLHNTYSYEMERYFCFSNNIMAVNCIHSDIQARMNGEDFDSDFNFVTNNPTMVKAAKVCYDCYPTVVNNIPDSKITYTDSLSSYAEMDSKLAKSQRDIGESSNLAQLAISYYFTELNKPEPNKSVLKDLSDNFIILAVLAQVAIDSTKRQFSVNVSNEISRIKKMPCMDLGARDFPYFMKYTKDVAITDGKGNELPYEDIKVAKDKLNNRINKSIQCPMNWLQDYLDTIPNSSTVKTIAISNYILDIKPNKRINNRQVSKVFKISKKLSENIYDLVKQRSINNYMLLTDEIENAIDEMKKIRINSEVMNYLIKCSLSIPFYDKNNQSVIVYKTKGIRKKILNLLYRSNKTMFLKNFRDFF